MELAVESGNDGTAKLLREWSRSTSGPARPGCDATSQRPTRWHSTRGRPRPPECGRRPDADLRRGTLVDRRGLLRRVRGTDRKPLPHNPIRHPPAEAKACPACGMPVSGRFCEACGHDSALPEPAASRPAAGLRPTSVGWTAVVTADREFYERVVARGGPDTVEFPQFFPERRIILQGRHHADRTAQPRPGRGTRDRPRHPARRPRRLDAARGAADPRFGPHRHRPRIDQRHQPQRQRRPAAGRSRRPHSPTAIASTSARGPRSRSCRLKCRAPSCPLPSCYVTSAAGTGTQRGRRCPPRRRDSAPARPDDASRFRC